MAKAKPTATPGTFTPTTAPPTYAPPMGTAAPTYPGIPVLDQGTAIVVLIVNLFFPGVGTIVAGAIGKVPMIGKGIAQLILSIIIVGWIWALVTSIQVITNSKK